MSDQTPTPILISACLLNNPVRYDGQGVDCQHPILLRWRAEGRIIVICPEVTGGLPTPRSPAEIESLHNGTSVLTGHAKVIEISGQDVSAEFIKGAQAAVALAKSKNTKIAILKEGSPSCGSGFIYDGSFSGTKITEQGVTAAALRNASVVVFNEHEFELADQSLDQLAP